jgi:hypothetical protein
LPDPALIVAGRKDTLGQILSQSGLSASADPNNSEGLPLLDSEVDVLQGNELGRPAVFRLHCRAHRDRRVLPCYALPAGFKAIWGDPSESKIDFGP